MSGQDKDTKEGKDKDEGVRYMVIIFPEKVELCHEDQQDLLVITDRMCARWEQNHPGQVMWGAGIGFSITSMPMTAEDDKNNVPMVFDMEQFEISCSTRADYHWPCAKCGKEQGDHKDHIMQPPAGDCDFEPARVIPRRRRGPPKVTYEQPTQPTQPTEGSNSNADS